MCLAKKKIFIAGATGLVGSSLINDILRHHPTAKIRAAYSRTRPFIVHKNVEYVRGDLKSPGFCRSAVKGCDCAIMAAAATFGSGVALSKPWASVNENLIMNARMLEAFHEENLKRVLFISSATLYQEFEGAIRESDLDWGKDPHPSHFGIGWTMRSLEKLCEFWRRSAGMNIIIVRASNIFGPYAKFDPETSNFIPALIRKAAERLDPFEIWGRPDVTRDVIFSQDFARAIVMLMNKSGIGFDVFNCGSETKTTVGDVVRWTLKHTPFRPSEIMYNRQKPTTIKFRSLDCSKLKKTIDWAPRFTVEDGIRITVDWWKENGAAWKK